jgi:hypothetical protein
MTKPNNERNVINSVQREASEINRHDDPEPLFEFKFAPAHEDLVVAAVLTRNAVFGRA